MNSMYLLSAATPEIALLIGACVVIVLEALRYSKRAVSGADGVAMFALLVPALALLAQIGKAPVTTFGDMFTVDVFATTMKLACVVAMAATIVYSRRYAADRGIGRGELYGLALMSLLGQFVMISGTNLLVIYLGLELMSLSMYAMVAMRRDSNAGTEAGMKYFVLGALASGFLLYGMSMVYGATGSLDIRTIAHALAAHEAGNRVVVFATVFLVAGIAFKFGAVPFHMWLPDVYHGAPTVATLVIAGGSKLAAFAMAFRLLADAMGSVSLDWTRMLIVLAVLSLLVGNVVAVAQTNLKRMLAYSTIGQVGFVLLGMVGSQLAASRGVDLLDDRAFRIIDAFSGSMFYTLTYVLTTLGTFGVILLLSRPGFECDEIADLKGLAKRNPWMAGVMLVLMFSLAGIPPMVGFYAKLVVLESIVSAGYVWLAVFAVLMSLIGAFYYLRVVKVMYFDAPVAGASYAHGIEPEDHLVRHDDHARPEGHAEHALPGIGTPPVSLHHGLAYSTTNPYGSDSGDDHGGVSIGSLDPRLDPMQPLKPVTPRVAISADAQTFYLLNGALVLVLGLLPAPLMNLCSLAVRQALRLH